LVPICRKVDGTRVFGVGRRVACHHCTVSVWAASWLKYVSEMIP
jgi:hypothetical protein